MSLSQKALREARHRAENDPWFLAKEVLGYSTFLYERAMKPVADFLSAADPPPGEPFDRWDLVLWPRECGKTTFDIVDLVRLQLKYPGICVALGHAKKDKSEEFLKQVRSEFEKPELRAIAPDICWQTPEQSNLWNQDKFNLRRRHQGYRVPSFMAISAEAMPTGFHFDAVIWDDLVIKENSQTTEQRDKCWQCLQQVPPLLQSKGLRLCRIFGTRWHMYDAYGRLLEEKDSRKLRILQGGMMQPDGKPLRDDVYCVQKTHAGDTRKTLDTLKAESGSFFYSCYYENDPLPEGTAAFKAEDVRRYRLEFDRGFEPPTASKAFTFFTATDFNTGLSSEGDHAVVLTCAKDEHGALYVVDIDRGHPRQTEHVEWIKRQVTKWKPERLYVEVVGYQKTFMQLLEKMRQDDRIYVPIEQVTRGGTFSENKTSRIMSLQGLMERGMFFVPEGRQFEPILKEISEFTVRDKGRMDDCLDCLAGIHARGRKPDPVPEATQKQQEIPAGCIPASLLLDFFDVTSQDLDETRGVFIS